MRINKAAYIFIEEDKMVTFNVNCLLYSVRILFILAITILTLTFKITKLKILRIL